MLESTRNTVSINHGTNGTDEKTTVDTNPQKVLEHENLISNSQYVTIEHEQDSSTSEIKTDKLVSKLNELENKIPTSVGVRNLLSNTNQGKTNWEWASPSGGATAEDYNVDGTNAVKLTYTADVSDPWSFIKYQGLIRKLIEPDTKYTLSFDVKPSVDVTFSATLKRGDSSAPLTNVGTMNNATANQWTKVSCVLTSVATLPDETGQVVYIEGMPNTKGNYLIIKNIKLEKGFISSDWSSAPEDIYPLLAQKQNKLTAMGGISITGDSVSLKVIDRYEGDLNNLTDTCLAKPVDNTSNLPTGVGGDGILNVVRISDVITQKYHALDNVIYTRLRKGFGDGITWTPWVKVTTTAI